MTDSRGLLRLLVRNGWRVESADWVVRPDGRRVRFPARAREFHAIQNWVSKWAPELRPELRGGGSHGRR